MGLTDVAVQPDTGVSSTATSDVRLRAFSTQLAAQGYAELRTPLAAVAPETEDRRR